MKVLALNSEGLMTYCTVPEEERGKGRCNHSYHAKENQTVEEFTEDLKKQGVKIKDEIIVEQNNNMSCFIKKVENYMNKKKLFKKTMNGYKTTPYAEYIVYSQAKIFFASKIVELDKDLKYHSENVKEIYDEKKYWEERKEYQDKFNELDKVKENYKIDHPDQYEEQERLSSPSQFIKDYKCDKEFTLDEAIQGYKYASEHLNNIDTSDFPKYKVSVIKQEYKEEVSKYIADKRAELGIPTEEYFKRHKLTTKGTRLKLNRQKSESSKQNKVYMEDIVQYLANL